MIFVVVEFGAGFFSNSLALVSDAGHNLSDVASLALALLAFKLLKVRRLQNLLTDIARLPFLYPY